MRIWCRGNSWSYRSRKRWEEVGTRPWWHRSWKSKCGSRLANFKCLLNWSANSPSQWCLISHFVLTFTRRDSHLSSAGTRASLAKRDARRIAGLHKRLDGGGSSSDVWLFHFQHLYSIVKTRACGFCWRSQDSSKRLGNCRLKCHLTSLDHIPTKLKTTWHSFDSLPHRMQCCRCHRCRSWRRQAAGGPEETCFQVTFVKHS